MNSDAKRLTDLVNERDNNILLLSVASELPVDYIRRLYVANIAYIKSNDLSCIKWAERTDSNNFYNCYHLQTIEAYKITKKMLPED